MLKWLFLSRTWHVLQYKLKYFNPLWFKRAGCCDSPYYWRRVGVLEISRVGLLALCSTRVRPAEMRYTRPCYPRLGELLLQYLIYVQYRFDWLHGNELCITGGISTAARLCRNAPLAHYCVGVTCTRIHVIRGLADRGTTASLVEYTQEVHSISPMRSNIARARSQCNNW